MEKELVILFHPLNTIYSYDFHYNQRPSHCDIYNSIIKEKTLTETESDIIKKHLSILPRLHKEVFERYQKENLITSFRYLSSSEEESLLIQKEHTILELDKYYKCNIILIKDVPFLKGNIIFISEEASDFIPICNKDNFCKIANWMIYKEDQSYLQYQQRTIPLLSYSRKPILYDLIIECFRQSTLLIKYLYINTMSSSNQLSVKELINQYFSQAINTIYILDSKSADQNYRKRELAQSSQKVKYHPFLNKHFKVDDSFSNYPQFSIWLQRCPYFYISNKPHYIDFIQSQIDKHKDVLQLHHISIIEMAFYRIKVYNFLLDFITNSKSEIEQLNMKVLIPKTIEYIVNKSINNEENLAILIKMISENQLPYPLIIKPNSCANHNMELVISEEGLKNLFENNKKYSDYFLKHEDFIVQEMIAHGGLMIKNFCINEESFSIIRSSIPDMKGEILKTDELSNGTLSFYNEEIYINGNAIQNKGKENNKTDDDFKNVLTKQLSKIDQFSLLFIKKTKIAFYGLDFLYDKTKDVFYILEINYFPSYRELGDQLHIKFDEHITKFYHRFKESK